MTQPPTQVELIPKADPKKPEANLEELVRAAQPIIEQWTRAQMATEAEKTTRTKIREEEDTKQLQLQLDAKKQPRLFEFAIAILIIGGLFVVIGWAATHGKDTIVMNGVILITGLIGGFGYGRAHAKKAADESD